jgi:hypothetical protein
MIISHSHRFIFIKSAKTAGTSIEAALSQFCSGSDVVTPLGNYSVNRDESGRIAHRAMNAGGYAQHEHGIAIKNSLPDEVWRNYFKFSIARNPWDRVLSLFFWKGRNDPALIDAQKRRVAGSPGSRIDQVRSVRLLFAQFVKDGKWQTNDRFYILDGELCTDYIVRYEDLGEDLAKVCASINLPTLELPHLKAGIRERDRHYSEYYDPETKAIVEARHANDIRYFGYRFEKA